MSKYYKKSIYSMRPICESDLEKLASHRNSYDTWSKLTSPLPVQAHRQGEWLRSLGTRDMYFIGSVGETPVDVALLRLTDIDTINRNGAVGIDVFEEHRGNGYATPLFALLCDYAFEQLGLNHLWLLVLEDNEPAKRVYTKVGFTHEGVMRKHIFRDGRFKDYLLMGLLKEEWNGYRWDSDV